MGTRSAFVTALFLTVALSFAAAWMKLHGIRAGHLLLAWVFLPASFFLIADALCSVRRDNRYPAARFVRLAIAAVFLGIHARILLARGF